MDEGDGNAADVTEEIRLNLGKALVTKADGATPEQAAFIANAANALLAPIKIRADDAAADAKAGEDKAAADKKAADDNAAADAMVSSPINSATKAADNKGI